MPQCTVARRAVQFQPEATFPFLDEARRNLRLLRQFDGAHGRRYRRLVRQYRAVADELGCRRPLERLLHPLRRPHSVPTPPLPWREARSAARRR
jgi:hypothetical protein